MNHIHQVDKLHFRSFAYYQSFFTSLGYGYDLPDKEGPVWIDNTDPSFVNWVGDIIENSRIGVEPFNGDFFKFKSFSALLSA